jgi:hypothetical protein
MKNILNKIKKHKILLLILAGLVVYVLYILSPDKNFPLDTGEYKPYILGQNIHFNTQGNSDLFVSKTNGWGDQEAKYRCTVDPDVYMKLYVNNDDTAIELNVLAAGSFPEPYKSQEVAVFVNGTQIATWDVSFKEWYSATIPASLIQDNKIEIRFNMARPYTPDGDTRKLGMIVSKIKLNKLYFLESKKQLKNWILKQLKNTFGELTLEEKEQMKEQVQ